MLGFSLVMAVPSMLLRAVALLLVLLLRWLEDYPNGVLSEETRDAPSLRYQAEKVTQAVFFNFLVWPLASVYGFWAYCTVLLGLDCVGRLLRLTLGERLKA
jgi:hypothetical protein